jgi:hypothetical protein
MKRILLSIVVLFAITTAFAQDEINYFQKKHEINVQVDDIFKDVSDFSYLFYLNDDYEYIYYYPYFSKGPSIGMGYKYHFGKGALRAKISFNGQSINSDDEDDNNENLNITSKQTFGGQNFAIGYELHTNLKRMQIFYGLDLTMGRQKINSENKYDYLATYEYYEDYTVTLSQTVITYGVKPFLGFKYFIIPQFSVSTEYFFSYQLYKNSYKYERTNSDVVDKSSANGYKTEFGPLGQITFGFHF